MVSAGAFPSAFWWRSSAGPPSLLVLEEFILDLGIGMNFWNNSVVRFGGGAIVSVDAVYFVFTFIYFKHRWGLMEKGN